MNANEEMGMLGMPGSETEVAQKCKEKKSWKKRTESKLGGPNN